MNTTSKQHIVIFICLVAAQAAGSRFTHAQIRSSTVSPRNAPVVQQTSTAGEQSGIVVQNAILKKIGVVSVASQMTGIINRLTVEPGAIVSQGSELGRIDDTDIRLKLEQIRTRLEMLKQKQGNDIDNRLAIKSKLVADNEYARALQANKRVADAYPRNEIDRLKLLADRAALELERSQYEQKMIKFDVRAAIIEYRQVYEQYRRHQIVAPTSGVVVSVEKKPGEWLEPGTEILQIVRIDRLRVEGSIPLSDAMLDLVGSTALVSFSGKGNELELPATVTFVSPDANPVNSLVNVYLEVDNSDNLLRPGLRVNAVIQYQP